MQLSGTDDRRSVRHCRPMEVDDLPIRRTLGNDERIASCEIERLVGENADDGVEARHDNGGIRDLQHGMFAKRRR